MNSGFAPCPRTPRNPISVIRTLRSRNSSDPGRVVAQSILAIVLAAATIVFWSRLTPFATAEEPGSTAKPAGKTELPPSPKAPSAEEIRKWIADLSHDEYAERHKAAELLLATGMAARQPLLEIAEGTDPEARAAARRLVALIDRSEFHRRLEAFAADTEGQMGLTLPGWEQYQKLVGSDPADRALFVEMQRQEGSLLSAVFGISKRAPEELWEARLRQIAQWPMTVPDRSSTPPIGSCAAILFLGSVEEINVSDSALSSIEALIQRSPVRESMQQDNSHEAFRKLLAGWVLHCPNKSDVALRTRLQLIAAANLEKALPLAQAVAGGDPKYARVQPGLKALAALDVGQFGKSEDVDRLEPLLEDSTICLQVPGQAPGQPPNSVQVRDVALFVMLHLTDQSPADYGYAVARLQPPRAFDMQALYRNSDQQRVESIAKWRAWRAAHKNDR